MKISDLSALFSLKINNHLFAEGLKKSPLQQYIKGFLKLHWKENRHLTIDEEFEFSQVLFNHKASSKNEELILSNLKNKLWGATAENIFTCIRIIYEYDRLDPKSWPEKYNKIIDARRQTLIAAFLMINLPHARETANFIEFIKNPGLELDIIYDSLRELKTQNILSGDALTQIKEYQLTPTTLYPY